MKYVEWDEPWPGLNEDGTECTVNLHNSMTVEDAIKASRAVSYKHYNDYTRIPTDEVLLGDFIVVHWADIKEVPNGS